MKSPSKLVACLIAALAIVFTAGLTGCDSLGTVSYQGDVKGIPVVVVVGGGK